MYTYQIIKNLDNKRIKDFNKYEREQFAQLHSRIANPLYIFSFALIPLIILKFSKKPGDSFLIPISIVSVVAFIFQITQITTSNLLIDKSNLVFMIYIFPIAFILIIVLLIFLDSFALKRFLNVK